MLVLNSKILGILSLMVVLATAQTVMPLKLYKQSLSQGDNWASAIYNGTLGAQEWLYWSLDDISNYDYEVTDGLGFVVYNLNCPGADFEMLLRKAKLPTAQKNNGAASATCSNTTNTIRVSASSWYSCNIAKKGEYYFAMQNKASSSKDYMVSIVIGRSECGVNVGPWVEPLVITIIVVVVLLIIGITVASCCGCIACCMCCALCARRNAAGEPVVYSKTSYQNI